LPDFRVEGATVDLPPGCRLTVEDQPAPAARNRLPRELTKFNRQFLDKPEFQRLGIFVRDADNDIAAGLAGYTYAGWLFVENLWVRNELRGRGLGREMMTQAEQRARERGCHSAYLDTFSFQAPDFYQKLGYTVFGTLDYPPEHRRFFLQKQLVAEI
jgi:ribosomal protein S18 acetylase RimI-like enzyme